MNPQQKSYPSNGPLPQPPLPSTHQTEQPSMSSENLSANGRKLFGMIEFDDKERLMCEIRKHPFGLFVIYFTGLIIALVILGVTIGAGTLLNSDAFQAEIATGQASTILSVVGVVIAGLTILVSLIGGFIYSSNVILVTNEKIAQVLYRNIIDRKISQLSIGDVQDVTVRQDGLFARLFNFGTLVIETAGEQQNYTFSYAPNPYEISKCIVNAHEENLKLYGN